MTALKAPPLPEHWRTAHLSHLAAIPVTNGLGEAAADGEVDWPRYIRTTDIDGLRSLDPAKRVTLPPEVAEGALVEAGDLLFTAAGSLGTSYQHLDGERACYAGYLVRFRPNESKVLSDYAAWWSQSQHHLDQIRLGAVRSTIDNFSAGKFRSMSVPLPPLSEQRAIADYLDRETAHIDTLIEEQQCLLGLLVERSQAVIDEAFEPATANATRVLLLLRHRPSYGVLKPDYVDAEPGSVSLIRAGDILRLHERPQLPQISSEQSAEYARTELLGGEVVLGVVGKLGQAAVVPHDMTPANTNRPVAVLRCSNEVPAELLALWFRTTEFHRQAVDATAGDSIQPTLGMRDLSSFTVSWPARPAEALDGLRHELSSIANLADSASRCIALTQERRAALITAAVTGQIDVGATA